LLKDLSVIEEGLKVFETEGINGLEYQAGGKSIEILAMDKDKNYVVIELETGRSYENIIGRVLRNKNWIQKNEAKGEQKVRGIIITNEMTEDLMIACENLPDIEMYEYELSIKLRKKGIK
jgi:RecB family endonuclease NucS